MSRTARSFSLDIFQLFVHTILRLTPILRSSRARISVSEQRFEGANQLLCSRRQQSNFGLPAPITPSSISRYLHQSAAYQICNTTKRTCSQGSRRSSGRSRHANHPGSSPSVQQKITPHIPQKNFGPPFSIFPPYFFKVTDLRFNTFLDTNSAK